MSNEQRIHELVHMLVNELTSMSEVKDLRMELATTKKRSNQILLTYQKLLSEYKQLTTVHSNLISKCTQLRSQLNDNESTVEDSE